jgi:hypothetical protein
MRLERVKHTRQRMLQTVQAPAGRSDQLWFWVRFDDGKCGWFSAAALTFASARFVVVGHARRV